MAGQVALQEWSKEAKLFYARMRVEGLSQVNAQEAVRQQFDISHIYGQPLLSRWEKRPEWRKDKVEYLAERQERFSELPFAKRYERISANAEMAAALSNRFWLENEKGNKANPNAMVKFSAEFRQCLDAIKADCAGLGIEDVAKQSGFEAIFTEGLKSLGLGSAGALEAMGVTVEDLKVKPS